MNKPHSLMILFELSVFTSIEYLIICVRGEQWVRVNMQSISPAHYICCKRRYSDTTGDRWTKGYETVKTTLVRNEIRLDECKCLQLRGKHEGLEWNCVYSYCYQRLLIVFTDADVVAFFGGNACPSITTVTTSSSYYSGQRRRSAWCSYRAYAITRSHESQTIEWSRKNMLSQVEQKASLFKPKIIWSFFQLTNHCE